MTGQEPARAAVARTRAVGTVLAGVMVLGAGLSLVRPTIARTETVTRALPATVQRVTLQGSSGDILVRAARPGESPWLRATLGWSLVRPTLQVDTRGDGSDVSISGSCEIPHGWFDGCASGWEVVVPADTSLWLRASSGDIDVRGTAGRVELETSSGDVTLRDSASPEVVVSATSGDVLIRSMVAVGALRASTSSGGITITVPDDASRYRVTATTRSGDVDNQLGTDPAATRWIDASASSGDITIRRG